MLLCFGPFCTVPGTQLRSSKTVLGTITPVKSSFAWSLNSTSRVSSLAVWVPLACLIWRGLLPGLDRLGLELGQLPRGHRVAPGELAVVAPGPRPPAGEDPVGALDLLAAGVRLHLGLGVVDVVLVRADRGPGGAGRLGGRAAGHGQ